MVDQPRFIIGFGERLTTPVTLRRGGQEPVAPYDICLLYTSPSPRDRTRSRMPSSA